MSGRLEGRIALVTGAGVGIGRATAVRLAGDGATVIATSRTLQHAEATCAEIAAAGPARAEAITLDVADSRRVEEVVRDVADRHGRIDVLVANAGVEPRTPTVEATTDDEWDRVFAVNARGVFAVRRAVLPVMPDGGAIVTVGSMNAFIAWPNDAAYTATKEPCCSSPAPWPWRPRSGTSARTACPGVIDTPLTRSFLQGDDVVVPSASTRRSPPRAHGHTERGRELHRLPRQRRGVVRDRLLLVDGGTTAR